MCNFCGVKGHKESQCFNKNPEKAPAWWKVKNNKAKSATPSVEVTLMSIANSDIIRVDIMALQAKKSNMMEILCNKNVWICDTGASTHVTWSSKCARNVHEECTMSLGHTGGAVEATAIMNIPGVFKSKEGVVGV